MHNQGGKMPNYIYLIQINVSLNRSTACRACTSTGDFEHNYVDVRIWKLSWQRRVIFQMRVHRARTIWTVVQENGWARLRRSDESRSVILRNHIIVF